MFMNLLFAALLAETLTIPFVPGGETSDYSTIETLQNRTTHRMTPRPCTVRLWADEEALHAILTTPVEESDPGGGFVAVTTQDGKLSVCQDDDIELFVAAEDGSAVYQTLFNSRDVKASIRPRQGKGFRVSDGGSFLKRDRERELDVDGLSAVGGHGGSRQAEVPFQRGAQFRSGWAWLCVADGAVRRL